MKSKNPKKTQSEIISYVLLIVIALGLASGVYFYLTKIIPSQKEAETCSDDVSVIISNYSCDAGNKIISLGLENRGLFNVNGFFIRASNDSSKLPFVSLNSTESMNQVGRYDFIGEAVFKPGDIITADFSYAGTDLTSIQRIQIQPYTTNTKTHALLLCKNIVDINLDGC